MKITWKGDTTGLDLKPTWEVEAVRVHTVKRMRQPDGSLEDTLVLAIMTTEEQYRELVKAYGRENIPTSILSLEVIQLRPNAVLWTWKPPKGYEDRIKTGTYTAFEITGE